jgi:hypothetical protein
LAKAPALAPGRSGRPQGTGYTEESDDEEGGYSRTHRQQTPGIYGSFTALYAAAAWASLSTTWRDAVLRSINSSKQLEMAKVANSAPPTSPAITTKLRNIMNASP